MQWGSYPNSPAQPRNPGPKSTSWSNDVADSDLQAWLARRRGGVWRATSVHSDAHFDGLSESPLKLGPTPRPCVAIEAWSLIGDDIGSCRPGVRAAAWVKDDDWGRAGTAVARCIEVSASISPQSAAPTRTGGATTQPSLAAMVTSRATR